MKILTILTVMLLAIDLSNDKKSIFPGENPPLFYEDSTPPNLKLNIAHTLAPAVPITISKLTKYLDANQSFQDVLISFAVNERNQLYFIALAANKPAQNESLTVAGRSINEFSSEKNSGSIVAAGSNRTDQRNFVNGIGNSLTIKAYYLSMSGMRTQMQVYENMNTRNIEVDIVSTSLDNQTYMDLIFPPTTTSDNNRALSTLSSGATREAPASGCPPFNCDY